MHACMCLCVCACMYVFVGVGVHTCLCLWVCATLQTRVSYRKDHSTLFKLGPFSKLTISEHQEEQREKKKVRRRSWGHGGSILMRRYEHCICEGRRI